MTMGQMSAEQVTLATHALVDSNVESGKKVIEEDTKINQMEIKVDELWCC